MDQNVRAVENLPPILRNGTSLSALQTVLNSKMDASDQRSEQMDLESENTYGFQEELYYNFVCEFCGLAVVSEKAMRDHTKSHKQDFGNGENHDTNGEVQTYSSESVVSPENEVILSSHVDCAIKIQVGDGAANAGSVARDNGDRPSCDDNIELLVDDLLNRICKTDTLVGNGKAENIILSSSVKNRRKLKSPVPIKSYSEPRDKTFRCPQCPWAFSTKVALRNHTFKNHSKDMPLRRSPRQISMARLSEDYLDKKSSYVNKLKSNSKREKNIYTLLSPNKFYMCKLCPSSFSRRKELRSHEQIHKLSVCELCGKAFAQAGNLKIHLRTHTKEKPYICEYCGKRYSQSGDLKTHTRVHTDEKPFLCEVCGQQYHSLSHLSRHYKVHMPDKPYTCKVCERSFKHTHHLKKHYRIHTQEKPYSCEICDKPFSRADYLKQHMRVHTKEKPYLCKICGKGFSQGGSLRLHQRVHTKELTEILIM